MENNANRHAYNPRAHQVNGYPIRRNARGVLRPPLHRTVPVMRVSPRTIPNPRTIPGVSYYRGPSLYAGTPMHLNYVRNTIPPSTATTNLIPFPIQSNYSSVLPIQPSARQFPRCLIPQQPNIRATQSPSDANMTLNHFYVMMPNGDIIAIYPSAPQPIPMDRPPFIFIPPSSSPHIPHPQDTPTHSYIGPQENCPYCPPQPQTVLVQQSRGQVNGNARHFRSTAGIRT